MRLKIHWGIGITVVYTAFVLFLLGHVVFSALQNTDLVEEDYYHQELEYQKKINKFERTKKLPEQLRVETIGKFINFKFPDKFENENIKGEILFYKPSDASMDRKFIINANDDNSFVINAEKMTKGFWRLKVNWQVNDSDYYNEEGLILE